MDQKRALALAPPGSRMLEERVRLEIRPDVYADTVVIQTPEGSVIVLFDGHLPDGGFARGSLEVDMRTYRRAVEFGNRIGGMRVMRGLLEQATDGTVDFRLTVPR